MKTLIAFYSRDGHTKRAAEIIAKGLSADIDEIEDKKSRKGIIGFLRAGYDATRGKTTEINFSKNPANYDVVIVGSPVWNGRVTPAIRTYLLKNRNSIKKIAFFVTCASREGKCLMQMREIYGGSVMVERIIKRNKIEKGVKSFVEELKAKMKENLG